MPNELPEEPFLKFLDAGVAQGGFETDDALAALLPLMKQAHATHQAAQVAPLDGIKHLTLTEQGHLIFAADQAVPPKKNESKVEALQSTVGSESPPLKPTSPNQFTFPTIAPGSTQSGTMMS